MTDISNLDYEQPRLEPLPGTVKLYQRHVFVCTDHNVWPARIESDGGFIQTLSEAVSAQAERIVHPVKITACNEASAGSGHCDLLVFPEAIRYLAVGEADIPALVEDHLVGGRVSDRIAHRPLSGQHLFVCIHAQRDRRCGLCGPPLIGQFIAVLAERGLAGSVTVRGTSHVGGHRFAGNVLIYPGGDWYGLVTPADVEHIVDRHLIKGQLVTGLWRGRLGLSPQEQLQQAQGWLND